jgi:signal transduction histidine kinase
MKIRADGVYFLVVKTVAFGFLLLGSAWVAAQTPRADSLALRLGRAGSTEQRVDLQGDLAMELYDIDWQKAFAYARQAYRQADQGGYGRGRKRALTLIGVGYFLRAELDSAIHFFRRSNQMAPELDWAITSYNWIMWAATHRTQSRFAEADSLLRLAMRALERENNAYYLAVAYRNYGKLKKEQFQLREADLFFQRALSAWILLKEPAGRQAVLWDLTDLEISRANYALAQSYLAQACKGSQEPGKTKPYQCFYLAAKIELERGRYREALELLTEALEALSGVEHKVGLALIRTEIGDVYNYLGQYEPALRNYFTALRLFEEMGAVSDQARVLAEIAWMFKNQDNFGQAMDYLNQSLAIRTRLNDRLGISTCYNFLGLIKTRERNFPEAIAALQQALDIREEIGYKKGVMDAFHNLSFVYSEMGELMRAADYLNQSIEIARQLESGYDLAYLYNALAALQIKLGAWQAADQNLKLAYREISQSGSKPLLKNYLRNRADLAAATGRWQEAARFFRQEIALTDSLQRSTNVAKMVEMQALHNLERKDREIEQLAAERKMQDKELSRQRWFVVVLAFGILVTAIAAAVIFMFYRQRIRLHDELLRLNKSISEQKEEIHSQTEELMEANQTIANINTELERRIQRRTEELAQAYKELDTFFYRSSHDFRRPITTFLGLAEVAKVTVKDAMALQLFEKVSDTARNLDRMLVKLQSISELGIEDQHPQPVDLKKMLDEVIFQRQTELLGIGMVASAEVIGRGTILTQPAWLRLIIDNVVENAIQFCAPENPQLRMFAMVESHQVTLHFEDNGQGIPEEYQSRIFNMYFRASVKSKGSGLGLYVVKKVVEKLHGTVEIKSAYAKGARVTVTFPCQIISG